MKTKWMMMVAMASAAMLWASDGTAKSIRLPLPPFEEAYKTADVVFVGKEVETLLVYCDFHKTGLCKNKPFNEFSLSQRYRRTFHIIKKIKGTEQDRFDILTENDDQFQGEYLLFIYKTSSRYYEGSGSSVGFSNNDPRRPQALEFIKKITGDDYAPSAK